MFGCKQRLGGAGILSTRATYRRKRLAWLPILLDSSGAGRIAAGAGEPGAHSARPGAHSVGQGLTVTAVPASGPHSPSMASGGRAPTVSAKG